MRSRLLHAMSFVLLINLFGCGCEIVNTGRRGVLTHFGKVTGEPLPEGLQWYNPISESVVEISVQEEKLEGKTACFTRDTQKVDVSFTAIYYPDPTMVGKIYEKFGRHWEIKLLEPALLSSMKDTIGQFIADELVQNREKVRVAVMKELQASLKDRAIFITSLALTNLDFDDDYEKAVERKVVAIQRAAESKNKTVEIEEQAKQKVVSAEAEAKSMRIRSQALSENKSLVEYEAVQKWDGKLPQYMMGNSVPFVNLK